MKAIERYLDYLSEDQEELEEGWAGGILGFIAGNLAGHVAGGVAGGVAGAAAAVAAGKPQHGAALGTAGGAILGGIGGVLGSIGGAIMGHRIQKWGNIKASAGLKKCDRLDGNNKLNCKIKALNVAANELKKGLRYCPKSKDPVQCKEKVMMRIQDYYTLINKYKNQMG